MNLANELQQYGINDTSVRKLDGPASPELLEYLDLIGSRNHRELLPDAVAEVQGRPLVFFINESRLAVPAAPQTDNFDRLRRMLALRGTRSYLARVLPGELRVTQVSLDEKTTNWKVFSAGGRDAKSFLPNLILGRYDGKTNDSDGVFKELFDLLRKGADRLALKIERGDVLSLIGRALFFRFLRDRQVITDHDTPRISPGAKGLKQCFDTVDNALLTCSWLDRTFNGDFLPLSGGGTRGFFERVERKTDGAVFEVLGAIVHGATAVGPESYQLKLDWGQFDFAHIPVGLLSQVHEKFIWTWADHEARETSVYYTPRNIAGMIVEEAFEGLSNPHAARVLDPACGAGVFLVLAFRRLYCELWKYSRVRPGTRQIRQLLENQISGFDISDSALKLAALSLYLTAIELDPEPVPPERLRFKNLQGTALQNPRHPNDVYVCLGSLAPEFGEKYEGRFDLVLSNPPWTSLPKTPVGKRIAAQFTDVSREIIRKRGGASLSASYQNPDNAPDLPFLWKSTFWCKPGGRIAMALPARILLKQEDVPTYARRTLFDLIEVNGILNGSNLADTNVWPEMQQPFMLLFARNAIPKAGHLTSFVTPQFDLSVNRVGEIRIDSKSAQPVESATEENARWLWKAIGVGTSLDIDVIRKLIAAGGRSLLEYWKTDLELHLGNGYQIKAKQKQRDASHLHGLPNLDNPDLFKFSATKKPLRPFRRPTACFPRTRDLYKHPLVLIKESPRLDRADGRAVLSNFDVAFNQSFHGFSGAGHPVGDLLVRYVHLLAHSQLWMHYALITSPKFGAERRTIYKSDLEAFPIIPVERLSANQRRTLLKLSKELEKSDTSASRELDELFDEIDALFAKIYGLSDLDKEVIRDTLGVSLPYKKSREDACRPVTEPERQAFFSRVEKVLSPFFKVLDKRAEVRPRSPETASVKGPFIEFTIGPSDRYQLGNDPFSADLSALAAESGATVVVIENEGGLTISLINQYRYWTPTRARLLAANVLQNHFSVFEAK